MIVVYKLPCKFQDMKDVINSLFALFGFLITGFGALILIVASSFFLGVIIGKIFVAILQFIK